MESNKNWHYDAITRSLHWVIAFLLIGLISLGWYMMSIEDQPNSGWYFNLHKSFGLIAAMLIFIRLLWRVTHKPAPLPSSVPHWQTILSRAIHLLLYFCMLIMPITGFIGSSFGKHGVIFFGVELPNWVNQSHAISTLAIFDIQSIGKRQCIFSLTVIKARCAMRDGIVFSSCGSLAKSIKQC